MRFKLRNHLLTLLLVLHIGRIALLQHLPAGQ